MFLSGTGHRLHPCTTGSQGGAVSIFATAAEDCPANLYAKAQAVKVTVHGAEPWGLDEDGDRVRFTGDGATGTGAGGVVDAAP